MKKNLLIIALVSILLLVSCIKNESQVVDQNLHGYHDPRNKTYVQTANPKIIGANEIQVGVEETYTVDYDIVTDSAELKKLYPQKNVEINPGGEAPSIEWHLDGKAKKYLTLKVSKNPKECTITALKQTLGNTSEDDKVVLFVIIGKDHCGSLTEPRQTVAEKRIMIK